MTHILEARRPTPESIEGLWGADRKAATLASLLRSAEAAEMDGEGGVASLTSLFGAAEPAAPKRSRLPSRRLGLRRAAILSGAAALLAATVVVSPALIGSESTSATAAIEPLVDIAENADPVVIPKGKFLHVVTVENPDGPPRGRYYEESLKLGEYPRTLESWMSSDGHLWRRDSTTNGNVRLNDFGVQGGSFPGSPSPKEATKLPDEPRALQSFLRDNVSGSNSRNEAVFVAIGELARSGLLPPKVRAASLEVIAALPEVTATKTTVGGSQMVRVDFADDSIRKDEVFTLLFDATTADLVEDIQWLRGKVNFRSVITRREIVSAMPPGLAEPAAAEEKERNEWIRNCNGSIPTPADFDCATVPKTLQ